MSNNTTLYDALSEVVSDQGDIPRDSIETLLVDASGAPSMRVFMDRAKVSYLTYLFNLYAADRVAIAEHLGCSVQNVSKMLAVLNDKYGESDE